MTIGSDTREDPWQLTSAPGSSEHTMFVDDGADPPLVEALGRAELTHEARHNQIRAI